MRARDQETNNKIEIIRETQTTSDKKQRTDIKRETTKQIHQNTNNNTKTTTTKERRQIIAARRQQTDISRQITKTMQK